MKRLLIAACAGSVLMMTACASGPAMYGPHYADATDFDAYYDDAYGPFYDGYWEPGGNYWYRSGARGRFQEDRAMHFNHGQAAGMHQVHGMGRAGGAGGGHAPAAFGGGGGGGAKK